ncbi:MAG: SpoIIE family protein phosphatase [Flavobacteriales bacterium]|nr:SpoIIE family protein phosphatase [Flavobacteriales bacterium]
MNQAAGIIMTAKPLIFITLIILPYLLKSNEVEENYMLVKTRLEQAEQTQSQDLVQEILKQPVYNADHQGFQDFATGKLQENSLPFAEQVYLNHQLMRYYVSVEADFDQSFVYLVELVKLLEGEKEHVLKPIMLGDAYFIASWINQVQHDLPRSRKYAEKLFAHATSYQLPELLLKSKMMLAELTQHEGDIAGGIQQFKTLEKEVKAKNDSILLNRLYLLLSNAYTDYDKEDSAFYYARLAYDLVPVHNAQLKAFSSIHLARGYMQSGELDKAIALTSEALLVVENLEAKKEIKDLHNFLAEAHKSAGNYEEALNHLEQFMTLDREQASLLSAANISDLESQMADEKHDFEMQLKQAEISQKNKQTIALAIFLVFAVIFIVFVIRGYMAKKRDAEIIRHQKTMVEEKNKEIMDSISYAKRIQSAILPPQKVVKAYLQESFVLYKPKDIVAGDFYWMETVNRVEQRVMGDGDLNPKSQNTNLILFAAADCTGHGVPGAMVSVVCNNGLNRAVREFGLTDPGQILDKARELVVEEFEKSEDDVKDGMDIALCSLKTQTTNKKQQTILEYAGANNPLWIIRPTANCLPEHVLREQKPRGEFLDDTGNKELEAHLSLTTDNYLLYEIKADKQPIGKFDRPEPYTTHQLELYPGDTIYIFSDGFADQFGGENGKKLKSVNFKKLLLRLQDKTMEQQRQLIDEAFEEWKGSLEQLDDVCVIGVKV